MIIGINALTHTAQTAPTFFTLSASTAQAAPTFFTLSASHRHTAQARKTQIGLVPFFL